MPTLTRNRPTLEVSVDFAANPTASYADIHETDDGLVSFWRLNSTSTLLDELGVNDGVQISTGTLIAGPYSFDTDQGLTYDGTNDSSYVLSSASLVTQSAFSVDGWIRVASLPGSTVDLLTKRGSWLLQMNSSGKLLWTLKDDTSTVTITSGTTITTNTWFHVTGVYDDANALLYINGVLDNSSAYSSGVEVSPRPIRFATAESNTAPTWQSSTTNTGSSTSIVANVPASVASGDLLLAHLGVRQSASNPTVTGPAGWLPWAVDTPSTLTESHVWYRISPGGEPASYTWTSDLSVAWQAAMTRITGQDALEPFANPGYSASGTGSTTRATGPHVPNTKNVLACAFFFSSGSTSWTEDSGTERYDVSNIGGAAIAMCSQNVAAETSLNVTGTATGTGASCAHMVFINGTGLTETACSLDDWAYWSRGLDEDEVARNYFSKDSGTPTWTDITLEVRNFDAASPERRNELENLVAGKLGMVLREVGDKDFDPGNTSSPYGPDVEQRVRVRAVWNSTTYDVFRGYVDRWTPVRLGADVEEVQLEATDGFDLLALAPVEGTMAVGFSGEHIDRILNKALWPVADRDIDAGQYVLNGYTIPNGTLALSLLQEIAASERGICFIDAANVFHFHDAAHRGTETRSTTSQATFSDHPGGTGNLVVSTEIRYQGIQPTRDKDRIVNVWTVSPDSGVFGAADQRVIDHQSVSKYGLRGSSRSTRLATNASALDQAGNLLNETAFPGDRYESMTVIPLTTESYDKCLDLRISDKVTVKRGFTPGWDGASMTRDYFIEGKTVSVADKRSAWQFTFVLSPVSAGNYYQTIMRDGPVSYWRMDTIT